MGCEYYNLEDENWSPMGPRRINVASLYERMPIIKDSSARPGLIPDFQDAIHRMIYSRPQLPLSFRVKAKELFRQTNIDTLWLKRFQKYWGSLGGRPLWHVSDFFFLRTLYRLRQSPPELNTIDTASAHLAAWQNEDLLFPLFDAVLHEAFSSEYRLLRLLHELKPKWASLLEYGAGSAPITSSIAEHACWQRNSACTICDIPTLTFHYAAYKFSFCSNIEVEPLKPEDDFQLITTKKFDVIFCCNVFEHINRPLDTVKRFVESLNRGGILFFDYIKSEGRGLDSHQGVAERNEVLDYIKTVMRVEYGEVNKEKSVKLVAARKI